MHDTTDLEERGVPAVFVASEEFRQAAVAQAESLGSPDRCILVEHPIQDRTDEEMRLLAREAADRIASRLTSS